MRTRETSADLKHTGSSDAVGKYIDNLPENKQTRARRLLALLAHSYDADLQMVPPHPQNTPRPNRRVLKPLRTGRLGEQFLNSADNIKRKRRIHRLKRQLTELNPLFAAAALNTVAPKIPVKPKFDNTKK